MNLTFLGATMGVTGSSHLLEIGDRKVLIDCGMFQGSKIVSALNRRPFGFKPSELQCVLLTHAHIDHSGLLPKLCKAGFRGPIYATAATIELCSIMLPDSAYIQEFDAEIENRKGRRMGRAPVEPLYSVEDAQKCLTHFRPVEYEADFSLGEGIHVHFHDAGHILGSSILEIHATEAGKETEFLFSGDLGRPNQPILKDPTCVKSADFVIMESTYGDRDHAEINWEDKLAEIINETLDRKGNIIIPAFAVGRTQIILYYLHRLFRAGRIPDVPVIIDSPLAISATDIFRRNTIYYDQEAKDTMASEHQNPLEMPQLRFTRTSEESKALNYMETPAIIISASGMADAGRILHHLKHNLWRQESSVLFVGFQAEGSLGRRLVEGVKKVRIMGEEIGVRAHIYNLEGLSAHADRDDIIKWLSCFTKKPANIFLVHGEVASAQALSMTITEKLSIPSYIPHYGDEVAFDGRSWQVTSAAPELPAAVETPGKELQDALNDLDSEWVEDKQKLENLVAADSSKMAAVLKSLAKVRKFVRQTLGNL